MSMFWIGVATLTVIALGILLIPILRYRKTQNTDSLNVAIAKQNLEELKREASESLIAVDELDNAEREIKISLAGEIQEPYNDNKEHSKLHWSYIAAFLVLLVSCSVIYLNASTYSKVNDWQRAKTQLSSLGQRIVIDADPTVTQGELKNFALALRTKLKDEPKDAVGWLLLGRVLSALNDINGSLSAFEKSYEIDPQRNGLLISYSQVLLLTDNEENIKKAKTLLLDSEVERNSLGLLAIATTRLGQTEEALGYWQKLKNFVPPSDPMYQNIQQRMDELQGTVTALTVDITVEEELLGKIPQNGYLFVFLQNAIEGMRMPAAVVKMPLTNVTIDSDGIQIKLDKSKAMMPGFTIDNIEKGRLVARVSLDENVDLLPGELQGMTEVDVKQGENLTYAIVINQEIR